MSRRRRKNRPDLRELMAEDLEFLAARDIGRDYMSFKIKEPSSAYPAPSGPIASHERLRETSGLHAPRRSTMALVTWIIGAVAIFGLAGYIIRILGYSE